MAFDFTCNEDMSYVLSESPWSLGQSTLVLQKWSSKLDLNESFFQQALIWVRFPQLPLKFWNEDVFSRVASTFGELLSLDLIMTLKGRLTYARICVGVKEGVDMPDVVYFQSKLGSHTQKIVYESVPFACFHCLKHGHKAFQCPIAKKEKKIPPRPSKQKDKKIQKKKNLKNVNLEDGKSQEGLKTSDRSSVNAKKDIESGQRTPLWKSRILSEKGNQIQIFPHKRRI